MKKVKKSVKCKFGFTKITTATAANYPPTSPLHPVISVPDTRPAVSPPVTSTVIKCDNDRCAHGKAIKGRCTAPGITLVKTWVGSESHYKLACQTASDYAGTKA